MKRLLQHTDNGLVLHYGDREPILLDPIMVAMLRSWLKSDTDMYASMECAGVSTDYHEFRTTWKKPLEELFSDFEALVKEIATEFGVNAKATAESEGWVVWMWSDEDPSDVVSSSGFSPASRQETRHIMGYLKGALSRKDDTMFRRRVFHCKLWNDLGKDYLR